MLQRKEEKIYFVKYTYIWLDHIVCTADAMSCVSKMEILYSCIHSDHHPVLFCLDCDIVPECNTSSDALLN